MKRYRVGTRHASAFVYCTLCKMRRMVGWTFFRDAKDADSDKRKDERTRRVLTRAWMRRRKLSSGGLRKGPGRPSPLSHLFGVFTRLKHRQVAPLITMYGTVLHAFTN